MKIEAVPFEFVENITRELAEVGLEFSKIKSAIRERFNIRENSADDHKLTDVLANLRVSLDETRVSYNLAKQKLILENLRGPIAYKSLAVDERARFEKYSLIENECLDIMRDLLIHYHYEVGEDIEKDKFIASLANSVIKNTQDARKELLKKYALDKIDDKNKSIKLEFFETFVEGDTE